MKTKEQKQKEAILRARKHVARHRAVYLATAPGTINYEKVSARFGKDVAEREAEDARKAFHTACEHAKVDTHGNPLPGYIF